jgi:hypothetical protein
MSFLGASRDEILMVAFIVVLVVAAPKIPKLGEWIGGLFGGGSGGEKPTSKPPRTGDPAP